MYMYMYNVTAAYNEAGRVTIQYSILFGSKYTYRYIHLLTEIRGDVVSLECRSTVHSADTAERNAGHSRQRKLHIYSWLLQGHTYVLYTSEYVE